MTWKGFGREGSAHRYDWCRSGEQQRQASRRFESLEERRLLSATEIPYLVQPAWFEQVATDRRAARARRGPDRAASGGASARGTRSAHHGGCPRRAGPTHRSMAPARRVLPGRAGSGGAHPVAARSARSARQDPACHPRVQPCLAVARPRRRTRRRRAGRHHSDRMVAELPLTGNRLTRPHRGRAPQYRITYARRLRAPSSKVLMLKRNTLRRRVTDLWRTGPALRSLHSVPIAIVAIRATMQDQSRSTAPRTLARSCRVLR
jgi:hypothetical protein